MEEIGKLKIFFGAVFVLVGAAILLVGYGPDPAPCLGWVRAYATHIVRGDHDHANATGADFASPEEYRDLALATREHTLRQLRAADLAYLAALPITARVELVPEQFNLAGLGSTLQRRGAHLPW